MSVVIVAPRSVDFVFAPIERMLQERGCESVRFHRREELLSDDIELSRMDILLASGDIKCDREVIQRAPKLRALISPFAGIEHFDLAVATEHGAVVANGQTCQNSESMAEATIMLMLALLYDVRGSEAICRDNLARPSPPNARMLKGKRLGLIGFGAIGQAVTKRLEHWSVQVQAFTRKPLSDVWSPMVRRATLDELLRTSDIVSIHATLNSESAGLLRESHLRLLKEGAILINTARGQIVDEHALVKVALERPDIKIALDVYEVEPLPVDSALRNLSNVTLTRHMVGHTCESIASLCEVAVENVLQALQGNLPTFIKNHEVVHGWMQRWSGLKSGNHFSVA